VADALGMQQVLVHPLAGVLSAYGMGLADQSLIKERAIELRLSPENQAQWSQVLDELTEWAHQELSNSPLAQGQIQVRRRLHVRFEGTDLALVVPDGTLTDIQAAFEQAYRQRFAFLMEGKPHIVEAASVEAIIAGDTAHASATTGPATRDRAHVHRRSLARCRTRGA
jgi:5-oxoprolinase (ATP-hydrolysing)